jgi:hypothetical protein
MAEKKKQKQQKSASIGVPTAKVEMKMTPMGGGSKPKK